MKSDTKQMQRIALQIALSQGNTRGAEFIRKRTRQTEMPIDGGYKLLVQTADDGDRINREQTEARAIMERIERAQANLPIIETTPRAI